jgi:flagellar assembly protein FliH
MVDRPPSRIPADESGDFVRWEIPKVHGAGVSVQDGQMNVKPMTASELEAIRKEAFEAGYQDGRKEGEEQGYQDGLLKGGEEGRAKGYAVGIEQGHEQGRKEKVEELEAERMRLVELIESFLYPLKKRQDQTEEALLNLVLAICRAVLQRELEISSSQIATVVHSALKLLPDSEGRVQFFLNPTDVASVQDIINQFSSSAKIIGTDEIMAGGCKVETSQSIIDATVEKRFQKVVQSMLKQSLTPHSETVDLADAIDDMSGFQRELLEADVNLPDTDDEDAGRTD